MRNGCAQAEQPAHLPHMTLQTVWYVEADAAYQVARRMMAPKSSGEDSCPFTSTCAAILVSGVLGSAPMLPEATWAFWDAIALLTSSEVSP